MSPETPSAPAVPETCRRWIEAKADSCGAPARYIVWGKLFDKDALGPRCEDCARDQLPATFFHYPDQYAVLDLEALYQHWEAGVRERLLAMGPERWEQIAYLMTIDDRGSAEAALDQALPGGQGSGD